MSTLITILNPILAILLIASILLQQRGTGLGAGFGGEGNVYRTKRGAEKMLFYATIVFATLFFLVSLANLIF